MPASLPWVSTMTPIHDHEINHVHKRTFDDYVRLALLLPLLGTIPAVITWNQLTLALSGGWDDSYLPGLVASYILPAYLLASVWAVARYERGPRPRGS